MFRTLESIIRSDVLELYIAPDDGLKSPKHVVYLMINKGSL